MAVLVPYKQEAARVRLPGVLLRNLSRKLSPRRNKLSFVELWGVDRREDAEDGLCG